MKFSLILALIFIYFLILAYSQDDGENYDEIALDEPLPEIIETSSTTIESSISATALKVFSLGFDTNHSKRILQSALSNPKDYKIDTNQTNYKLLSHSLGYILATKDVADFSIEDADIVLLYMKKSDFLIDNTAIEKISKALNLLVKESNPAINEATNATNIDALSKKSLFVLLETKSSEGPRLFEKLSTALDDAWTIAASNMFYKGSLMNFIDIQVISVSPTSSGVSSKAIEVIDNSLEKMAIKGVPLEKLFESSGKSESTPQTGSEGTHTFSNQKLEGIGIMEDEIKEAISYAQRALTDSAQQLQKYENSQEFSNFISNLINVCVQNIQTKGHEKGVTNQLVLDSAANLVTQRIFLMSSVFFRRQVQILRQNVIKAFNSQVVDDFEISVHIARDLDKAKRDAVKSLRRGVQLLSPKNAPLSWSCEFDVLQLEHTLDDYIQKRKAQARLEGILPRGRKPLEISLHLLLTHPLGKDYRQDIVTGLSDSIIYDQSLAKSRDILVKPYGARAILKEKLSQSKKFGKLTKSDSEFAREMLMFPLSIKNPAVPLVNPKGRRRSSVPKIDTKRTKTGPERFIRWDLSPLDEVKSNLDAVKAAHRQNPSTPPLDLILNIFPMFGNSYYDSPPLRYGTKFAPSKR